MKKESNKKENIYYCSSLIHIESRRVHKNIDFSQSHGQEPRIRLVGRTRLSRSQSGDQPVTREGITSSLNWRVLSKN